MPAKRKSSTTAASVPQPVGHDNTGAVTAFLGSLKHPLKPLVETIRATILETDSGITEGIKWNTASFYCHGWFATINLRAKKGVQLVLHHGAKVRDESTLSETIVDPSKLLTWLAKDRTAVTFINAEDFQSRRAAFQKIIKQWVQHQAGLAKAP
ncbi:MAG: hypothetical protein JWR69_2590 [Pedosphaera sp.]|nr:hypothetical protein [Pedosphaera sp.]